MADPSRYKPIEEYGIIGDLHTVALVGMDGSIDFMCFPHFDSPSIFAAILDAERGGRFMIQPVLEGARHKQLYLPDTNILLTRFLSSDGVAEISDFMTVEDIPQAGALVRRVKTVRGEVRFRVRCAPRFDYARAEHRLEQREGEYLFFSGGKDRLAVRLRTSLPLEVAGGVVQGEFALSAGESAAFILEYAQEGADSPSAAEHYEVQAFKDTMNFWRNWTAQSQYQGRWREMVNRSALVLKLLTSQPHGSIVAAPTFGLPEVIGGVRNWDYRFTWIRDASFTLYALMRLGFMQEAAAFMHWLEERCTELDPGAPLQVMYGLDGRHDLSEERLSHLEGYHQSAPVRIGNAAHRQLQLDIYGELMDAVYIYNKYGEPIHHDLWVALVPIVNWVCENWHQPDEGIWEVRSGKHEFLYSRLMTWVAVDRAIRLARKRSFPAPLEDWYRVRDTIYRDIFHNFWNPERQAFVQHLNTTRLDAANLLMPMVKFISPNDPRWLSTLRAIEQDLVSDSLVYRYHTGDPAVDGLTGQEGTFSMCTFWYVECLSRAGDLQKARFYFEKMLGYANHLGLYAEELGPSGQHLGNYPQAFTHLALISAAYDLNRRLSGRDGRVHRHV